MSKLSKAATAKLSAKQLAELKALQAMPDSEIDYSDIAQTTLEDWQGADAAQGKGYQTRINELLRRAMMKEAKH